jgi:hypothetical protein
MGVVENGKFGRNAELCPSICHARLASYDSPQRVQQTAAACCYFLCSATPNLGEKSQTLFYVLIVPPFDV